MAEKFDLKCADCGMIQTEKFAAGCSNCNGLIEAIYPLDNVRLRDSDDPQQRYYDLLPVHDDRLLVPGIRTRTVHAKTLGKRLGLNHLYLKDETQNATGTTKDRMAAVALPFLYEGGVRHFCTSSTGNSSTSYAQSIGHLPDMNMEVFTAEDFKDRVHYEPTDQVRHHILKEASFVDAGDLAIVYGQENGLTPERGFFNLGRREGLKLPWFEALEQVSRSIDWYVQAISSAMGVHGVYKAAKEAMGIGIADKLPRLLNVQQTSCMPMVRAWQDDSDKILPEYIVKRPHGIAEAILRGNPSRSYPIIRGITLESGGTMLGVENDEIYAAQALVREDEGIEICLSSSTAIAGLIKMAQQDDSLADQKILVNLTGSNRVGQNVAPIDHWWKREGDKWVPAEESAKPLRTAETA